MRLTIPILILVLLAACDPAAGIRVTSRLAPEERTCLDSVVVHSRLLSRVDPVSRKDSSTLLYNVFFDISTQPRVAGLFFAPVDREAAEVTVSFFWIGRLKGFPDSARTRAASVGAELLRELQATCGSLPPNPITCEQYQNIGKDEACHLGAG
jgi:hypothetical protein